MNANIDTTGAVDTATHADASHIGDTVVADGVTYIVGSSIEPGENTKRARPKLVATLGLYRPKGQRIYAAHQFIGGAIRVFATV